MHVYYWPVLAVSARSPANLGCWCSFYPPWYPLLFWWPAVFSFGDRAVRCPCLLSPGNSFTIFNILIMWKPIMEQVGVKRWWRYTRTDNSVRSNKKMLVRRKIKRYMIARALSLNLWLLIYLGKVFSGKWLVDVDIPPRRVVWHHARCGTLVPPALVHTLPVVAVAAILLVNPEIFGSELVMILMTLQLKIRVAIWQFTKHRYIWKRSAYVPAVFQTMFIHEMFVFIALFELISRCWRDFAGS